MSMAWSSPEAEWVRTGSALFDQALANLPDGDLRQPSELDGWTKAHVVSHVSANAQAIGRLLYWARTGEPTFMYSSPEDRDQEIEAGSQMDPIDLRAWWADSESRLRMSFAEMPEEAWQQSVVTAQGREVEATETLWMRSREVCIHAVDVNSGVSFSDLPEDFLVRLVGEAVARHSASGRESGIRIETEDGRIWEVPGIGGSAQVRGPLAGVAQWLTGRGTHGVEAAQGRSLPALGKWL